MPKLDNYLLTRDSDFADTTKFYIVDHQVKEEIKQGQPGQTPTEIPTEELAKWLPYKTNTHEFAMVWACLSVQADSSEYKWWDASSFWQRFLLFVTNKQIPVKVKYFDQWMLYEIRLQAYKMALEQGVIKEQGRATEKTVCVVPTYPFLDFEGNMERQLQRHLLRHYHQIKQKGPQPMDRKYQQEFLLILNIAKQIYKIFALPRITLDQSDKGGKQNLLIDCQANPFPVHKYFHSALGVYEDAGKEICAEGVLSHDENYAVKYQRGDLHHLGDELSWVLGAMANNCEVEFGYSAKLGFLYKIGQKFCPEAGARDLYRGDQPLVFKSTKSESARMFGKSYWQLVIDKNEEADQIIPSNESLVSASLIHNYGNNPVFQKFAGRWIDSLTTTELKQKLLEVTGNSETQPFLLKSILGKFVLEIIGGAIAPKSTYVVKESKNGISREALKEVFEKGIKQLGELDATKEKRQKAREPTTGEKKEALFNKILTHATTSDNTRDYLKALSQDPQPQWIVSELIDMHDEYRIFVVNHQVSVGTPCHRHSTPFNLYPWGRFHPGLCFSHRSKAIRLNQKTRNLVAKYIKFARLFAREMKEYGKTNTDYKVAKHGNYVLDVAWSRQKQQVVAIEINACEETTPGDMGMYAVNTPRLASDFLRKDNRQHKFNYQTMKGFVDLIDKLGFHEAEMEQEEVEAKKEQLFYFDAPIKPYIDQNNLPIVLQERIFTGKNNLKYQWRENLYLKEIKHPK